MQPERASDHVRFAVYTKKSDRFTPGEIARLTGLEPDQIGFIAIESDHILVDVHKTCKQAVRSRLVEIGGCKLLEDAPFLWRWLRLAIGRNHGLTMRKLRSVLESAEAQPVGRIHLNNAYTLVGLREDRWEPTLAALANTSVSGIPLRPREADRHESRSEDPRYTGRTDED
jgi:hypothetical protein